MIKLIVISVAFVLLSGCEPQSRGFNLPPGDTAQGEATFILMQCNNCHSIKDSIPWSGETLEQKLNVVLGGPTTQVKTYGDLVTSIIHPSHKLSRGNTPATVNEIGESRMRNYNDVMSVQELIDLVAFLQSKYEIWVPDYYTYRR